MLMQHIYVICLTDSDSLRFSANRACALGKNVHIRDNLHLVGACAYSSLLDQGYI